MSATKISRINGKSARRRLRSPAPAAMPEIVQRVLAASRPGRKPVTLTQGIAEEISEWLDGAFAAFTFFIDEQASRWYLSVVAENNRNLKVARADLYARDMLRKDFGRTVDCIGFTRDMSGIAGLHRNKAKRVRGQSTTRARELRSRFWL